MEVFTAATIYSFIILVFSASDVDVTSAALFIGLVVVCAFDELTMECPALAESFIALVERLAYCAGPECRQQRLVSRFERPSVHVETDTVIVNAPPCRYKKRRLRDVDFAADCC
ncbi:hypothetical protein MRX96_041707 [Rhipicephalus microplus]